MVKLNDIFHRIWVTLLCSFIFIIGLVFGRPLDWLYKSNFNKYNYFLAGFIIGIISLIINPYSSFGKVLMFLLVVVVVLLLLNLKREKQEQSWTISNLKNAAKCSKCSNTAEFRVNRAPDCKLGSVFDTVCSECNDPYFEVVMDFKECYFCSAKSDFLIYGLPSGWEGCACLKDINQTIAVCKDCAPEGWSIVKNLNHKKEGGDANSKNK